MSSSPPDSTVSPSAARISASLADALTDADWLAAAREALAQSSESLGADFERDMDIDRLLARRARDVDAVLVAAWRRALPENSPACLIATGGYGRGELFPESDIDLLVLVESADEALFRDGLERFFASLWDIGLSPGHALRSLEQCVQLAADDLTVVTALMEARLLAGPPEAFDALMMAISPDRMWPASDYFRAKRQEQIERHARYNDTAYNLEPNLKDGPGGLRDVQTLLWMARRLLGRGGLAAFAASGALGEDEFGTLERERRALSRLRFGLHRVAGRREERLLFEHQKELARLFGFEDRHRENLAVEQLMQGFYRSAALVLRLNSRILQRFEEHLSAASGEGPEAPVALEDGFEIRRGYLAVADVSRFRREPLSILRLFQVWQRLPSVSALHSETARALGEALDVVGDQLDGDPEAAREFMAIVRGPGAVDQLSRMARLGVLGRYLPAFGRVSGRMQFDLFHVYTVDEHTLAVLRNIASFANEKSADRFSLAHQVWPRLRKPELLLLAGLFHDIAKGRGGDHSELGAEDARAFGQQHGLTAAETDLIEWLVRQHLLMSVTAQRKDISDPEVVQTFGRQVGDRERLDYLYLLTVADIAGTSPKLWNAWKDRLLADLYAATRFALRRGLEHRAYAEERIAETREAARERLHKAGLDDQRIDAVWAEFPDESYLRYRPEQIAWQTIGIAGHHARHPDDDNAALVLARPHQRPGALEVFVYCPDRDGLFATVAAALDRLELPVVEARVVNSLRGMSLDTFQVVDTGRGVIDPERRAQVIVDRLDRALAKTPYRVDPVRRAVPRQLRHFRMPAQVEFRQIPEHDVTELSLVCADRPGLLAQVAAVLREHDLRVHDARIATYGERVEDIFQISDEADHAIVDEARLAALRQALVECVDSAYGKETGKAS